MPELERYLLIKLEEHPASDSRLLRDFAYEHLKDAIRYANLPPGEPLSENRISKILGISRTPVREALQMLNQEGLVEIIPGRAVQVASRSFRDVIDVLHIRILIEPELARLATEAKSEGHLVTLWECLAKMEAAVEEGDRQAWSRSDTIWHEALSDACPNRLLGELALQMRNRIHNYSSIDHQLKLEQLRKGTAEHRRIVEAMASGDEQGAERHMREHLENLRRDLFNQLIYS